MSSNYVKENVSKVSPKDASFDQWYEYFKKRLEAGLTFTSLNIEFENASNAMNALKQDGIAVENKAGRDEYVICYYTHPETLINSACI